MISFLIVLFKLKLRLDCFFKFNKYSPRVVGSSHGSGAGGAHFYCGQSSDNLFLDSP